MNYKNVELGEICDFVRGVSFDGNEVLDVKADGYVPILRAGNIQDELLYIHDDLVWVPEKRVAKEQYFQVGDIAICMASGSPAVLGKTAQLNQAFTGSVGAFCGIIRPKKVDPIYIAYWFKSESFLHWRDDQANGVNIQNLRPSEIKDIQIPLSPLPEQHRIADLLTRADRLRRLRRVGDTLSASLLQSVFLEMFGDPKANPKGWYYFELDELGLYISDGNYSSKYPRADEFVSKGIPFIRANNLKNHTVIWDDMRFITLEKHAYLQKGHIRTDDLLITTRGNIGLVGLVPSDFDDANINAQLVLIRCKGTKLNPRYLLWVLEMPSIREQFDYLQTGTALQQLPVGNLIQLEIPVPPLPEQEQFAAIVRRVEALRGRGGESDRQGEGLFQSLLHEAFSN